MFAKLYGPDDDQVLITFDEGEDGPEVRFSCQPQGLGVCSAAIHYEDNDDGWDKADDYFQSVDEGEARNVQRLIIEGSQPENSND